MIMAVYAWNDFPGGYLAGRFREEGVSPEVVRRDQAGREYYEVHADQDTINNVCSDYERRATAIGCASVVGLLVTGILLSIAAEIASQNPEVQKFIDELPQYFLQ